VIPARGHLRQNGAAVQRFAILKMSDTVESIARRVGFQSYFIGHQANLTMLRGVCERSAIPDHRHLYNVDRFGNCGSAGAPSVLSENWDRFKTDDVTLAVVGAGLTWAGVAVRFERSTQCNGSEEIQNVYSCV
jgi:3-oxoacyl-[acyl-carrier-protein] synthase-3